MVCVWTLNRFIVYGRVKYNKEGTQGAIVAKEFP